MFAGALWCGFVGCDRSQGRPNRQRASSCQGCMASWSCTVTDDAEPIETAGIACLTSVQSLADPNHTALTATFPVTPRFSVLKKTGDYELRQYDDFLVASIPMGATTGPASGSGFPALASYIFGANKQAVKMDMTTPVLTSVAPKQQSTEMEFVMENRWGVWFLLLCVYGVCGG